MNHPEGLIGWVDLSTTDVAAATSFYSELFGWTTEDIPTPMGPAYTMASKDGLLVAGIGPQPPGSAARGSASMWNSYVIVQDLDAICGAVPGAGGQVVMAPMDVMSEGRMAVVMDPSGAVIGVWQPIDHQGAQVFNVPGALTWNELQSRDLAAAIPFYEQLFGWRFEDLDGSGYTMIMLDTKPGEDKSNGAAMSTPAGVPDEVPSCWLVYFAVEDCDAAVARAVGLGASVFLPAMQMGPGRFAGLTDPTGASLMLGAFGS